MNQKNKGTTKKRELIGVVVSDKMQKTRVVEVERLKKHPRYEKYFRVSTRLKAHDENNKYKVGDKVLIRESRPLSKEKRWVIVKLIEESKISKNSLESLDLDSEELTESK
jgi:small subunit ribosomal protein S17